MQYKFIITLVLLGLALLSYREYTLQPNGNLQIHIGDVGQGDGILLTSPTGNHIVIDGGPNLELLSFLGKYMPWFDRTIELLVLTHPDADHITALPEVLRRYKVETIVMTGIDHNSGRYQELISIITKKNIPIILPELGQVLHLGNGATLEILWPANTIIGTKPDHPNDTSVVMRAHYGNESMLLTGDIEYDAEIALLATGQSLKATHLKVAHHGSKTSTSTGFLLAVQPTYAIIPVGADNKFGHPHNEITQRLKDFAIPHWNTAKHGDYLVEFVQ